MISLQTNVASINAQNNLSVNNTFQNKTIQQLTSGYRINSSGDDAAGLAIANSYRNNISEVTQGISNANDAVSQLQIVDGGLSNISTILDRLKTLATESASSAFTGNRATLNQEYQQLTAEITRQAGNINLNSGGSFNTNLNVYIGGANNATSANVSINLSGAQNGVDAASLGLANTNVLGGGALLSGNTTRLDTPGATFVVGSSSTANQTYTFNVLNGNQTTQITATVKATSGGSTATQVMDQLNSQLSQYGITAGISNSGTLEFSGATPFTIKDNGQGAGGTNVISNGSGTAENTSLYTYDTNTFAAPATNVTETLSFSNGSGSKDVTINPTDTETTAIASINAQTSSLGIYAFDNGGKISFQSANNFSINDSQAGTGTIAADSFGNSTGAATEYKANAPTTGDATNANAAITAINNAIQSLGAVQGRVGAGENTLQYAISLAQSQITNFSSAESQIRDANVAADAANLTKSQVLVQTSIAALAQANSEPQSVLKLLQG